MRNRSYLLFFLFLIAANTRAEFYPGFTPGFVPPGAMFPYSLAPGGIGPVSPYMMLPGMAGSQNPFMMMMMNMGNAKGLKYQRRTKAGEPVDISAFSAALEESRKQSEETIAAGQKFAQDLVRSNSQRTDSPFVETAQPAREGPASTPRSIDDILDSIQKNQAVTQKLIQDAATSIAANAGNNSIQKRTQVRTLASTTERSALYRRAPRFRNLRRNTLGYNHRRAHMPSSFDAPGLDRDD